MFTISADTSKRTEGGAGFIYDTMPATLTLPPA